MIFQEFANELIIDVIKTAFNGDNLLPIMKVTFPSSIVDSAIHDSDEDRGKITSTEEWEFEIEVLLTGKKYIRYMDVLDLPATATIGISVQSDLSIRYSYYPGNYQQPPEEDIEINSIENTFNSEIAIDGEPIEVTGEAKKVFEEFSKQNEKNTDEDMEYTINTNWKKQFIWQLINHRSR